MITDLSRRDFLRASLAGVAGIACSPLFRNAGLSEHFHKSDSPVILFQGDSITDSGRNRGIREANVAAALGTGYPLLVAASALRSSPDYAFQFFNRGVSGDKVPDLRARWSVDTIALKPDVVSVLVGVNDFWHKRLNGYTGTVADYEDQYVDLLTTTRQALPLVQLVVLEPFVLRHGVVDATWFPEFDERRSAAARAASRAGATFVPLQDAFTSASAHAGAGHWTIDGVHPTPAGHELIAERWSTVMGTPFRDSKQ